MCFNEHRQCVQFVGKQHRECIGHGQLFPVIFAEIHRFEFVCEFCVILFGSEQHDAVRNFHSFVLFVKSIFEQYGHQQR